jgi:hypothetical protein
VVVEAKRRINNVRRYVHTLRKRVWVFMQGQDLGFRLRNPSKNKQKMLYFLFYSARIDVLIYRIPIRNSIGRTEKQLSWPLFLTGR